jgi:hypothetical protein
MIMVCGREKKKNVPFREAGQSVVRSSFLCDDLDVSFVALALPDHAGAVGLPGEKHMSCNWRHVFTKIGRKSQKIKERGRKKEGKSRLRRQAGRVTASLGT